MKPARVLLCLLSFLGLALTAALAVDRLNTPSVAPTFVWATLLATAAALPTLFRRRVWPVALLLLALGAVVLARLHLPAPPDLEGLGEHLAFYTEQFSAGIAYFATHRVPLDLEAAEGLRLLLGLALYGIVWVAAVAALGLRRPVAAIVILAVPLVFGLTLDEEVRTLVSPVAFLLFAACLLLTLRTLHRRRWTVGDTASGLAGAALAIGFAVWIAGSTSFAASPAWQDWRTWDVRYGDARFSFDSMEGYAGLLDPDNDVPVMEVTSPVASYWRANALDRFNGEGWYAKGKRESELERDPDARDFTYAIPAVDLVPQGTLVRQKFTIGEMESDYYLTGGVARALTVGAKSTVHTDSNAALGVAEPLPPGTRYALTAVVPKLKPEGLVGLGRDYPEHVLRLAKLPFPTPADSAATALEADWRDAMQTMPQHFEWLGLYRLNQIIVKDATDPYEIALRIERYLRVYYFYSLTTPSPRQSSPYAAFLFDSRLGFCQHFAGAMAILVRFNGIPARVAVGFAPGDKVDEDRYLVSSNDAHAWVEVYFPRVGWVAFEPTTGIRMPGSGGSSTGDGFRDPFFAARLDLGGEALKAAHVEVPRGLSEDVSRGLPSVVAQAPARSSGASHVVLWAAVSAFALITVAWPFGRALLRRRGLGGADPGRRLRVSLALVDAELRDFGVVVPRSFTLDELAVLSKERLGVEAAPLVARVQEVLFGGRAATEDDVAAAAAFRRELRHALRARFGRRRALLARYGLNGGGDARSGAATASLRRDPHPVRASR
jgi:transglutaminase-like putative cysteine protease